MTEHDRVRSVSVAIPAHNASSTIEEQLDAIREQDAEWIDAVVVVDSMSTDDTAAMVRRYSQRWPKVHLAVTDRPGANVARNTGVAATTSDAVLLCDADDVVTPNWAQVMYAALQLQDVVRGRYSLTLLNDAATIAARGSLASTSAPDLSEPFGGLGGNCGFMRSAWEQLGGLLEHHYGSDDAEFFWRARLAGLDVGYADDSVVNYRLRPGMRPLFRQQRLWASGRAQLYKEFGSHGLVKRRSIWAAIKAWGWLTVHVLDAGSGDPVRKGRWVRQVANAVGRIQGSVRHRVLYL